MRAVGVRELKARLSHYLRRIKAGERVLVTERGQVIAELAPPAPLAEPYGLARLAELATVSDGEGPEPGLYASTGLASAAGTAARLVDLERG